MKKKNLLKIALFAMVLSLASCSKDDRYTGISDDGPDPVEETDPMTPQNVRTYMSDPQATDETVALFYNMRKLQKTKYLVGQMDAFAGIYNGGTQSDIKSATGSDPALLGSDFMFITDKNNDGTASNWFYQQELAITADVKEAYDKGMVNTFNWHIREPNHEEVFYTADMTDAEKATAFKSILPGGDHNDWFKLKLDKVASILNNLKGTDGKLIPVIFRPFHEFDGNWFWWGSPYGTADDYKAAFQFLVTYLRDTKNVHNVLYAFGPGSTYTSEATYLSRYPGDGFIDVLTFDYYGNYTTNIEAKTNLAMVSKLSREKVKVAGLAETGNISTGTAIPNYFSTNLFNALTVEDTEMAFIMFWSNSTTAYYTPPAGQSNTTDFVNFANKAQSVLQDNIPDMYTLPSE